MAPNLSGVALADSAPDRPGGRARRRLRHQAPQAQRSVARQVFPRQRLQPAGRAVQEVVPLGLGAQAQGVARQVGRGPSWSGAGSRRPERAAPDPLRAACGPRPATHRACSVPVGVIAVGPRTFPP
jgi:hypothetical protein